MPLALAGQETASQNSERTFAAGEQNPLSSCRSQRVTDRSHVIRSAVLRKNLGSSAVYDPKPA
jgi:hypothetical protein